MRIVRQLRLMYGLLREFGCPRRIAGWRAFVNVLLGLPVRIYP